MEKVIDFLRTRNHLLNLLHPHDIADSEASVPKKSSVELEVIGIEGEKKQLVFRRGSGALIEFRKIN